MHLEVAAENAPSSLVYMPLYYLVSTSFVTALATSYCASPPFCYLYLSQDSKGSQHDTWKHRTGMVEFGLVMNWSHEQFTVR